MADESPLTPLPGQAQLPGFLPEIPATRSKAFIGAWRKGRQAALDGRSLMDCPYPDRRCGPFGRVVTFSRAYRKFWRDGFESVGLFPLPRPANDQARDCSEPSRA